MARGKQEGNQELEEARESEGERPTNLSVHYPPPATAVTIHEDLLAAPSPLRAMSCSAFSRSRLPGHPCCTAHI